MFCPHCGQPLPDGAKFCASCGKPVVIPDAPAPEPAYVPEYTPAPDYGNGGYVPPEPPYYGGPGPDQQPKKKSKKGLVIGLVSAVALLAALAAAFFLWIYPSFLSSSAKYEKALNQAQTALSDEEYDDAVDFFTDALERAEDKAARSLCLVGRGDAYMGLEEYEDAIDDYEAALKLDDSQKKVWTKLADAYLAAEDTDGAIEALNDGIDATGASSLETKLDELLQGGGSASNKDTDASISETGLEPTTPAEPVEGPATVVDEITLGGVTFSTDETEITLTYAGADDIAALSNCWELRYLDLTGNNISDLGPLRSCTKLEYLLLDENNISDLSALSGLTNLVCLRLEGNRISDLSPLRDLTNLGELRLNNNDISDVSALSGLRNLSELGLWNNPVRDISALSPLTNLTFLDLDGTLVSDVTPLLGLTNLETLYVSGDNLPGDAWNIIAEALPQFADHADPATAADSIVVAISPDYPPYEELLADGTLAGFDIDYVLMLGEVLGCNIEFVTYEFDQLLPVLNAGEADMVISAMVYTEERAAAYAASDPYITVSYAGYEEPLCIFLPYGDPRGLLPEINEAIAVLEAEGVTRELTECWGLEY